MRKIFHSSFGSSFGASLDSRLRAIAFGIILILGSALGAQEAPRLGVLANGLEYAIVPMPQSALISVRLAYRAGAEAQVSKTAGFFKLMEALLFRGSIADPGEPEPAGALEALQARDIEGGSSLDSFSIGFSVEPSMAGPALDTLAALFSELRFDAAFADPAALEEAKTVVSLKQEAAFGEGQAILEAAFAKRLFSAAPWRLDIFGPPAQRAAAAAQDLRALATSWLVPNNAFLSIAGSLDPDAVEERIRQAFDGWKRGANPWNPSPHPLPKPGVTRPALLAMADPNMAAGQARVEMRYRGPDSASPRSVQAELWARLANDPGSRLAKALARQSQGSPGFSDPAASYRASRAASWLSVSASFQLSLKINPAETAINFKETARGTEMYAMKTNPSYFAAKDLEAAKSAMLMERSTRFGDPRGATDLLVEDWLLGGAARIKGREASILSPGLKDLAGLADEYFMKNLEVLILRLNAQDLSARRKSLESYGLEILSAEKAFWWR